MFPGFHIPMNQTARVEVVQGGSDFVGEVDGLVDRQLNRPHAFQEVATPEFHHQVEGVGGRSAEADLTLFHRVTADDTGVVEGYRRLQLDYLLRQAVPIRPDHLQGNSAHEVSGHILFGQKHRTESTDAEESNQPELAIELASHQLLPHASPPGDLVRGRLVCPGPNRAPPCFQRYVQENREAPPEPVVWGTSLQHSNLGAWTPLELSAIRPRQM